MNKKDMFLKELGKQIEDNIESLDVNIFETIDAFPGSTVLDPEIKYFCKNSEDTYDFFTEEEFEEISANNHGKILILIESA